MFGNGSTLYETSHVTINSYFKHLQTLQTQRMGTENVVGKGENEFFSFCLTMFSKVFFLRVTLTLYSTDTHFDTSTTDSF